MRLKLFDTGSISFMDCDELVLGGIWLNEKRVFESGAEIMLGSLFCEDWLLMSELILWCPLLFIF